MTRVLLGIACAIGGGVLFTALDFAAWYVLARMDTEPSGADAYVMLFGLTAPWAFVAGFAVFACLFQRWD